MAMSAGFRMTPRTRISRARRRWGSEEGVVQAPLRREIRDRAPGGTLALGAQRRDHAGARARLQAPSSGHLDERLVDVVQLTEALLHPRGSLGERGQPLPRRGVAFWEQGHEELRGVAQALE